MGKLQEKFKEKIQQIKSNNNNFFILKQSQTKLEVKYLKKNYKVFLLKTFKDF